MAEGAPDTREVAGQAMVRCLTTLSQAAVPAQVQRSGRPMTYTPEDTSPS